VVWTIVVLGLVLATTTNGYDPTVAATWSRWDSGHYLYIAQHGYDLFPCPRMLNSATYQPGSWCGHAGWFPAYPWLVGAVHRLGFPVTATAVVVSWSFALSTLLLLWRTFLRDEAPLPAAGALLFAAFVPGQIYHYAIFPLSMLAFFTVLHLWLLREGRWLLAGLAGAVAAMTYPIGVLLAPMSALWIAFILRDASWGERLRRLAVASGLTAAGFVVVLIDMQLETGAWDAYFKIQAKYDHDLSNPLSEFRTAVDPALHGSLLGTEAVPALQTLFIGIVMGLAVMGAARRWRALTAIDGLLLLWAAFYFVLPLTQDNVSLYRSQATLLPLALVLLRLPPPLLFVLVGAALWLTVPMAQLFLTGKLI
jgi:hypothetical protein